MHCLMVCPSAISYVNFQKGFQECLYINHCGISNPLSPTLSASLAMKTI
jgi:hypothetical protein